MSELRSRNVRGDIPVEIVRWWKGLSHYMEKAKKVKVSGKHV